MARKEDVFDKAMECCHNGGWHSNCPECPLKGLDYCHLIPSLQDINDGCKHEFWIKFEKEYKELLYYCQGCIEEEGFLKSEISHCKVCDRYFCKKCIITRLDLCLDCAREDYLDGGDC